MEQNVEEVEIQFQKFAMGEKQYYLNKQTNQVYTLENFVNHKENNEPLIPIGRLEKKGKGYKIV
jgi:hypothetical protein